MNADDLKQISKFAVESREILLDMISPMLDERLVDQPVEALAIYLANLRWSMYQAIESLSRMERMAETMAPVWGPGATPKEESIHG